MKRGEIWTAAGGKDYAGKPRPVVIVQDDRFAGTDSITICAFTSDPTDAPLRGRAPIHSCLFAGNHPRRNGSTARTVP